MPITILSCYPTAPTRKIAGILLVNNQLISEQQAVVIVIPNCSFPDSKLASEKEQDASK
jgi:hypothetical protein